MAADPSFLIIACIFLPLINAAALNLLSRLPNLRDVTNLAFAAATAFIVYLLQTNLANGQNLKAEFFDILPNIPLYFKVEPLGIIYAGLASCLWFITIIYSIGYLRVRKDIQQTRFFMFMSISIAASIGIAFAGNLLTMLIFYEALTFATYPLVTHKGDDESISAGRKYLAYLLGSSIAFLLPAIIITYSISGNMTFAKGGVFMEDLSATATVLLLLLFVYGTGKAALMPMHHWLPSAMVAPTPVSALLHAVAVVKAGVFCIIKIITYIFSPEMLSDSAALLSPHILSYLAAASMFIASIIAIRQDNLKTRLAYSTIAQLSYIILAASIFTYAGTTAAAMHMVSHGLGKITLFFAAGAIITTSGHKNLSELNGIGRKMPVVAVCFFLASLSLIGLPGFAGGESKHLITAAADAANMQWMVIALYAGMALTAAYLLPVSYYAFCRKPGGNITAKTPLTMQLAILITTALTLGFYFYEAYLTNLARSI